MKKTITTIVITILTTISLSSFAHANIIPLKSKDAKEVLLTYVEATTIGIVDLNELQFTADFQYENSVNKHKYGKKDYLKFLTETEGLSYECDTEYKLLDATGSIAVAKTTSKYDTFTRIDHVTMINTDKGWKINKIITTYK